MSALSRHEKARMASALSVLVFRCQGCDCRVLPGANLCLDCKYGPLDGAGE